MHTCEGRLALFGRGAWVRRDGKKVGPGPTLSQRAQRMRVLRETTHGVHRWGRYCCRERLAFDWGSRGWAETAVGSVRDDPVACVVMDAVGLRTLPPEGVTGCMRTNLFAQNSICSGGQLVMRVKPCGKAVKSPQCYLWCFTP